MRLYGALELRFTQMEGVDVIIPNACKNTDQENRDSGFEKGEGIALRSIHTILR